MLLEKSEAPYKAKAPELFFKNKYYQVNSSVCITPKTLSEKFIVKGMRF